MKLRLGTQGSLVGILGIAVVGSTLALTRPNDYAFFDPLLEVKSLISQRYVGEVDTKAMQTAALKGMVEALNDPYAVFVPASETREFEKELTGDFVGIGVQIVIADGWLTVVTPLEDSPAFKAGVMAEDRIVEVEGTSTFGLSTTQCIDLLAGEPGTKVNIVVERDGERLPLKITRQRILTRTVKGFHWEGSDKPGSTGAWQYFIDPKRRIAYIRLTQFTPTSGEEFAEALRSIGAAEGSLGGLILDLRWNPGGVLQEAVKIADLFLQQGAIVSTKGRAHRDEVSLARAEGTLPDFPVAVLINSGSASASEVVSGALTENGRAIAVGTRTFGKGLVQAVLNLPSGVGQLKMTEQRYYLPSGRSLQRSDDNPDWGVDPTDGFFVPLTDEETAAMVQARSAHDILKSRVSNNGSEKWSDPDWVVGVLKDKQLAAALKAVQAKLDGGPTAPWVPTGQPLPMSNTLAAADLDRAQKLRDRMERELLKLDRRIGALQSAAGDARVERDLWPDTVQLAGGRMSIYDRDGNLVTELEITSNDLERWLIDADVRKIEPARAPENK
jgi:carboxyl-terminal processing protease